MINASLQLQFARTKRLDPRITFTRASTATYYDQNGRLAYSDSGEPRFTHDPATGDSEGLLVEEQRTNYCLYSEDFRDTATAGESRPWINTNGTVTSNTAEAPDGEATADTFTATAGNALVYQGISTTAISWTFSIFIKRKTGSGNVDVTMDGSTWVTQTISSTEWTRCIVTQTGVAGTSNCGVRLVTSGDEVYIWGAQAE